MSAPKNKEKRIDKELFLLRNLPKDYKLGKKETQLGTLLDVSKKHVIFHNCYQMQLEISRSAVKSQFLDKTVERFYFDILLRDKYPFQPPIIMTRTTVSTSTHTIFSNLTYLLIVLLTISCRWKRSTRSNYSKGLQKGRIEKR